MAKSRIVIVEDSEIDRKLLLSVLRKHPEYESVATTNGKECLAALEEAPTDLVLLDFMLGAEIGTDILKKIREKWDQDALPVIMITGLETISPAIASFKLGANDYVTKPVIVESILARIQTLLKLSQLTREVARLRGLLSENGKK